MHGELIGPLDGPLLLREQGRREHRHGQRHGAERVVLHGASHTGNRKARTIRRTSAAQ